MINDDSFSLPYWDWTKLENRNSVLSNDWFGESVNGTIHGRFATWQTICWNKSELSCDGKDILCDPTIPTGPIRRCPVELACNENSTLWPTQKDVDMAIGTKDYDSSPYSFASNGFRSYAEGFVNNSCGSDDQLCSNGIERKLHNAVSYW